MTGHGKTDHPAPARVLLSRWRNLIFDAGYYAPTVAFWICIAFAICAGVYFLGGL